VARDLMTKGICLCVASAVLLAAPFLNPILFPLAWVAFLPLLRAIDLASSLRDAAIRGWVAGFATHLMGFYWLVSTISVFGNFSYPLASVVFLIYAALQGLQIASFAFLVKVIGFGPLQIFPALFWVALEFCFPLLFPWHLANSQSAFLSFIQTADLVGPYGASWVIMWMNGAIYKLAFASNQQRAASWITCAYPSLFFALSVIYGVQRLETIEDEMAEARKLPVAAVQGNIDVGLKWDPAKARENLARYVGLSSTIENTALIAWPETAVEYWLPDDLQSLPRELMPPFSSEQTYFLFGSRSFIGHPGERDFKAFNTAFIADARGRVLGRYHKQVLLAFGEYIPFSKILSLLPMMPFADGFTAGDAPLAFNLRRGLRLSPLICYEDLMPELARRAVSETRANLLVNMTNDAWYGRTVAPWQHARLSQWRSIETRRTLLRATNTGVTTWINPKGEIQNVLPLFTGGVLQAQVELMEEETYYVRLGDWFAWAMTGATLALLLVYLRGVLRKHGT
jgi:apolipoprotein N-acyltransferase